MIAFAPMPNPKYAISVVIENAESGGSVAGPVAVKVLNSLIKEWSKHRLKDLLFFLINTYLSPSLYYPLWDYSSYIAHHRAIST
mgnify:FL=1